MPQMAPMSWLILYIFFIFMFMLMIILNYYSFLYLPKNNDPDKNIKNPQLNWKW